MTARAYVETSIPSFCAELVTSLAVIDELQRGNFPTRANCLDLLSSLPVVAVDTAVLEIVQAYIQHRVMPSDPLGDALHLALASYHRCDFLVTWNCKHLANANKFGHIRRVNAVLGLYNPALVTHLNS